MNETPLWASESFWKKTAIWVTGVSFVILIVLTMDSLSQTAAGGKRVPSYAVINKKIDYQFNKELNRSVPIIGEDEFLFGKQLSEQEAAQLVDLGKKTVQTRNCMNCHTLLGNGAYYAPDLTKAWLDQGWLSKDLREDLMVKFLMDPEHNARTFGSNRKMPNLGITEQEAKGLVAFLKWMSGIDTNGFPYNFKTIEAEE
ncbi:c-type cytochrome [Methylobacter sp. YRD-M1]|uniref:c-type cytochrome n=1 Tax=Methylobacter sp. YRD-M1 TaxID=2911520 RepID=UPI00227D4BC4|nr:cytochrome c [Methylobacter sp. YRD-M1]WAK00239.1 cytochrome c [Methylobacter sp. YRD-M1]